MPWRIGYSAQSDMPPDAEAQRPMLRGVADLTLERRAGRTRLTGARTRPPLLVQHALYPDDGAPDMAYVFLANPTGGFLEHDRHEICISVGAGARAHVTTQSATKVHTMTHGVAEQRVALNVAAGGYLEYLPDPLIPFRNASLVQRADITVEPGAALVYGDTITPGRVARGEAFQYCRLSNRLAVHRREAHPVYREAFDIAPDADGLPGIRTFDPICQSVAEYTATPTLGSLLILCDSMKAGGILDQAREQLARSSSVSAGASLLPDGGGVGVKMIGEDCSAVQAAVHEVWSIARRALLGTAPQSLRKY